MPITIVSNVQWYSWWIILDKIFLFEWMNHFWLFRSLDHHFWWKFKSKRFIQKKKGRPSWVYEDKISAYLFDWRSIVRATGDLHFEQSPLLPFILFFIFDLVLIHHSVRCRNKVKWGAAGFQCCKMVHSHRAGYTVNSSVGDCLQYLQSSN